MRNDPTIVHDLQSIPPGASNPVRVKFMTGFNSGYRDGRIERTRDGLSLAVHSEPFQVGYKLGVIAGGQTLSQDVLNNRLNQAWYAYHGSHHGTDLTAYPDRK